MVVDGSSSVTSRRATAVFVAAIVLLVLQRVHSQRLSSSYGTHFYIGFMRNIGGKYVHQYTDLQLVIGTTAESAEFMVETSKTIQTGKVSSGTPVVVPIPKDEELQVTGSDFDNREKGVHVFTTGGEPIFVLAENLIPEINHGTYLAYPCMETESDSDYEYYIISTDGVLPDFIHSQFLLVGCENNTTINIKPSQSVSIPEDPQMATTKSVTVGSLDTSHDFTLHQMQTLLISSVDDLTGTKIVSDKPLTVISGHECGDIPSSSFACEPLSIHVPPSTTWGTKFLLAPFAGKDDEQLFKLVTAEPTTVVYTCGMNSSIAEFNTNHQIKTKDYCYLNSTKPLLVAQFSNEEDKGDPAIAMISPLDHYVNEITFFSLPSASFPFNYISVTVSAEHYNAEKILLNGTIIECEWMEIMNDKDEIVGYGCSLEVASGDNSPMEHTVSHLDVGGLVSVLVYGFNAVPGRGYAYLAGQSLIAEPPTPTTLPPTTAPPTTAPPTTAPPTTAPPTTLPPTTAPPTTLPPTTAPPTTTPPTTAPPTTLPPTTLPPTTAPPTTAPPTTLPPTTAPPTTAPPTTLPPATAPPTTAPPTTLPPTTAPPTTAPPTTPPPIIECPPDCTFDYCNARATRRKSCTVRNPQGTCDVKCIITDCRACYYDEPGVYRSLPGNCAACPTYPTMDDDCLRSWGVCIRRANNETYSNGAQTKERFKCYEHPCV